MADSGNVRVDPLFKGLTRPTMILGVSIPFVILNALASFVYFIQTADFRVILGTAGVHLFGYVICFKEPLFIELYQIKLSKCNKCSNKLYHGANSYDVF
jgi:type IV secretion system protein VirB3